MLKIYPFAYESTNVTESNSTSIGLGISKFNNTDEKINFRSLTYCYSGPLSQCLGPDSSARGSVLTHRTWQYANIHPSSTNTRLSGLKFIFKSMP